MRDKTKEKLQDAIIIVVILALIIGMIYIASKVAYLPEIKESCKMQVSNGHYTNIKECIKYELKYNTYYYNY